MLGKHDNIGNSPSADYSEHHEPFQYYASTSNPSHLSPNYVDSTTTDQSSITQFIEDNWNLGRIGNSSADSAAGSLMSAFDFNQRYGHAPAIIMDDSTGEITKTIPPSGSGRGSAGSSRTSTTTSTTTTTTTGGSGSAGGGGKGGSAHGSGKTITLPTVTCRPTFKGHVLTFVCTTRGGSHVPTLIRIRLFRGRSLVGNQAARVHGHTARFTVRKRLRKGSYKVRVTVDAAGRVGAETRTLRVR